MTIGTFNGLLNENGKEHMPQNNGEVSLRDEGGEVSEGNDGTELCFQLACWKSCGNEPLVLLLIHCI